MKVIPGQYRWVMRNACRHFQTKIYDFAHLYLLLILPKYVFFLSLKHIICRLVLLYDARVQRVNEYPFSKFRVLARPQTRSTPHRHVVLAGMAFCSAAKINISANMY